jgi:hypothetical protein
MLLRPKPEDFGRTGVHMTNKPGMPRLNKGQARSCAALFSLFLFIGMGWTAPPCVWAQSTLENPQPGSFQSGIGVISGWACNAQTIDIEFDGVVTLEAAYGTSREDTRSVCGDANNGFGLLFNWNLLGDGPHTVRALADGQEFANVTFTVTTLGTEFLRDASGSFSLAGFPETGSTVSVRWQESAQNFVLEKAEGFGILVRQGERALGLGNFLAANALFTQAAAVNPNDSRVNFYRAITQLMVTAIDDPRVASLAIRNGVVLDRGSSDFCGVRIGQIPPRTSGTGEIIDTVRTVFLPALAAAIDALDRLPDSVEIPFSVMNLPSCLRQNITSLSQRPVVVIDHSDILALKAALQAAQAALELLGAYDFDFDWQAARTQTRQQVVTMNPNLLTLKSADGLTRARGFTDQALTNASLTLQSILAETDDQSDDLLIITSGDIPEAQRIMRTLDLVHQSLQTQVTLPTDLGLKHSERLNLNLFFSAQFATLRPFLPAFDNNGDFDLEKFPDPTFGGTAPDLTQQELKDIVDRLTNIFSNGFSKVGL